MAILNNYDSPSRVAPLDEDEGCSLLTSHQLDDANLYDDQEEIKGQIKLEDSYHTRMNEPPPFDEIILVAKKSGQMMDDAYDDKNVDVKTSMVVSYGAGHIVSDNDLSSQNSGSDSIETEMAKDQSDMDDCGSSSFDQKKKVHQSCSTLHLTEKNSAKIMREQSGPNADTNVSMGMETKDTDDNWATKAVNTNIIATAADSFPNIIQYMHQKTHEETTSVVDVDKVQWELPKTSSLLLEATTEKRKLSEAAEAMATSAEAALADVAVMSTSAMAEKNNPNIEMAQWENKSDNTVFHTEPLTPTKKENIMSSLMSDAHFPCQNDGKTSSKEDLLSIQPRLLSNKVDPKTFTTEYNTAALSKEPPEAKIKTAGIEDMNSFSNFTPAICENYQG